MGALVGIPFGGAKGGVAVDPADLILRRAAHALGASRVTDAHCQRGLYP